MAYYKDENFIKKVGLRLKELRLEKGYSQEEIAHKTGFPTSQIGRIERGEINTSISHIAAFSKALNIHPKLVFDFCY